MKKLSVIFTLLAAVVVVISCSDVKRKPSRNYMPDMAYSRAVETYSDHSGLNNDGINYDAKNVKGTVSRNEDVIYQTPPDTTGLYASEAVMVNPLPALDSVGKVEAERLFLINCGICHGAKLDGNGPLYKGGEGPFPAKPAALVGDANYEKMSEGTMFHAITYGKNMMGSYASQLTPKQRWMVIHYIKGKQSEGKGGSETAASTPGAAAAPKADSTAKK
jgi:mono/diheme cytochrome c family protein